MTPGLFGVGILIGLLALGVVSWRFDVRTWNEGLCRKCWSRWVRFDTDSQGGRGYKCGTSHGCWITWPVDRVKP